MNAPGGVLTLPAGMPTGAQVTVTNIGDQWMLSGCAGASPDRFVLETLVMASDLDHDAYKLPVSELVNLWVARYGNEWVDADMVDADPFFKHVHRRLRSLGELEQHYLTDRNKYVCRRPE